ncbi:MAG TPA: hypothetical protein VGB55_12850 [Tepidisphaeraceae bacterium]
MIYSRAQSTSSPNRGIALIMVIMAVGLASVMAVAVLATAQMRATIAGVGQSRLQGQYLAQSGLNLAVYYIEHPEASPVPLKDGYWGSVHYPGENNLRLSPLLGELTITVVNTAIGQLTVTSVATIDEQKTTATAKISLRKSRTFEYASFNRSGLTLNSLSTVTGGLYTDGAISPPATGQVSGTIVAANGALLPGGQPFNPAESTEYPISLIDYYAPTYFYQGRRCTAQTLPQTVGLLLPIQDIFNNPANVWYVKDNNTTFSQPLTMVGTIVTARNRSAIFTSSVTITPFPDMPALVVGKDLEMRNAGRTVRLNGVTYVGGLLRGNSTATGSTLRVNGAFISGNSGWPVHSSFRASLNLQHNASAATVSGFADELEKITSLHIDSWSIQNGTPQ